MAAGTRRRPVHEPALRHCPWRELSQQDDHAGGNGCTRRCNRYPCEGASSAQRRSSLDVPVLGFSLRAVIDQQSFSFSQFWQAIPTLMSRAGKDQLRGWLEYIFFQFRQLEFSLGYEEPPAFVTVQGSKRLPTIPGQRPTDVSEQILNHAPELKRPVDDLIDQFGNVIVAMLQKAAERSTDNCARGHLYPLRHTCLIGV